MKINIDISYQEFLWICTMALKCERAGFKIEKVNKNPDNNEVTLTLEEIVLGEQNEISN